MTKKIFVCLAVASLFTTVPSHAQAFSLSFTWDNLKSCFTGRPNRVSNPRFKLSRVPKGTKTIKFKMVDLDVPSYRHGGGSVQYSGQKVISPGAFKYKSPCPPDGRHTYEWTATALGKGGEKLGVAKSRKRYP